MKRIILFYFSINVIILLINTKSQAQSAQKYFEQGKDYLFSKFKFDSAILSFTKAIQLDKTKFEYYQGRGFCYKLKKEIGLAFLDLNQAVKLNVKASDSYEYLGDIYSSIGDYQQAETNFNLALLYDNASDIVYAKRAELKNEHGKYKEALSDINKAIELYADEEEYFFIKGNILSSLKQFSEAVLNYDKALAIDSDYEEALIKKALANFKRSNYEEAIKDAKTILEADDENVQMWWLLGAIKDMQGDCFRAIEYFTKCIELDHTTSEYPLKRGICRKSVGDKIGAFADFKASSDLGDIKGKELLLQYCK